MTSLLNTLVLRQRGELRLGFDLATACSGDRIGFPGIAFGDNNE